MPHKRTLLRELSPALLAAGLLLAGAVSASASAETFTTNCTGLQAEIEKVAAQPNGGEGDVLLLNGMCGASGSNEGSYVLPAGSAFTLEGAPGTTSGFDAEGLSGSNAQLRTSGSEDIAGMTLSHLTFEHSTAGALHIRHQGGALTLSEDSFTANSTHEPSPVEVADDPMNCSGSSGSVTIERSLFDGGTGGGGTSVGAGGGMSLLIECRLDSFALTGNTFSANSATPPNGQPADGGGLSIANDDDLGVAAVTQSGNVFDSNQVVADGSASYSGGGETTLGVALTSTGDRFTRNALPGASGTGVSWGAGLSVENSGCQSESPSSRLIDDVLAANTILDSGSEEPARAQGAGIYVGCGSPSGFANHLAVLDSTVTANAVSPAGAGAVAGIAGHPSDQLTLANTILHGDSGGAELGGFTGPGGSLSAAFSDVCEGASPLSGEGNICADPLLEDVAGPGIPEVQETGSSPTLDAGSNALVPGGLSTDFFGGSRILAAKSFTPPCTPGVSFVGAMLGPAVVDIGAAELGPVAVPAFELVCPTKALPKPLTKKPPSGARLNVRLSSARVQRAGVLTLKLHVPGKGKLSVRATFKLTTTVKRASKRIRRTQTVTYGTASASYTAISPRTIALTLKPTHHALALLKRHRRLRVTLRVAFLPAGGGFSSQVTSLLVTYKPPPHPGARRHRRG